MKTLALLLVIAAIPTLAPASEIIAPNHKQLVMVITSDWNASTGRLQRFESGNEGWRPVGKPEPVVVGRAGLGWGRGLHPEPRATEPVKREGDGKGPAGIFRLGSVFGYAATTPNASMPYLPADVFSECVDDPNSSHYNRVVNAGEITNRDWRSSERMHRKDDLYRLGVVVDHNADNPGPGAGSCIFLHIWRSAAKPTVGCTALAPNTIHQLIAWLDQAHAPILVQLPRPVFEREGTAWGLPKMEK